ncbi:MAG: hypothetical protein JWP74_1871 [Marmoricola sp.]|nr:hypothetical protein [Marmoricola sp.]
MRGLRFGVLGVALELGLGILLAGCGSPAAILHPEQLSGDRVAAMAERELEAAHPGLAAGQMTCPDLPFRLGASVRCARTASLSHGRRVGMDGTVKVTRISHGGRLHVQLDRSVSWIGVSGDQVADDLERLLRSRYRVVPRSVSCPDLRGTTGATTPCVVRIGGHRIVARAHVVRVDAATYTTYYRFVTPKVTGGTGPNRGLPSLLRALRHGGFGS